MRRAVVAGIVALWVVTGMGSAAVRKVPSEYPRIQSAIDAAEAGDTIIVSPGVYYETINFGGKDIVVTSTDPNDPRIVGYTVINADGDGTVVTFENGETNAAVLTGFTITGGFGTLDAEMSYDTQKLFWGAGILCKGASPTVARNVIANNRGAVEQSPDGMELKVSYGGGIACYGSDAVISHNIIRSNFAYAGGGIMTYPGGEVGSYSGRPKIRGNLIYNNTGLIGGGVVMIGGEFVNNTIVANSADVGAEFGSGLGANIYVVFDPGLDPGCLWNNIICDAAAGGGLLWEGTLLTGIIAYNDVWNNVPGNYGTSGTTGELTWDGPSSLAGKAGNISADPLFANPLNRDYHLTVDSPCINAGNPDLVVTPGEQDIDRGPRVYAARIDIGADEYVGYVKPAAEAGTDRHVLHAMEAVTLDGRRSFFYDPCGLQTYRWSQVSGPPAVLDDPNRAQPTFTPAVEGEYVFQLVVSDARYTSEPDKVLVLVAPNQLPVANAGSDKAWRTPSIVILNGTSSFDPDKGDPLTYQWTQVEGESVFLQDANTASPSFHLQKEGAYVFELVVSDGIAQSEPSRVRCVGIGVRTSAKSLPGMQSMTYAYYPDVSGTNAVFSTPGQMSIYDARITCQDLISGKTEVFGTSGINLQARIDGNLVVWAGGPVVTNMVGPDCTSVLVRNLATGVVRELRTRSDTSSYSHPAVSGNKVVWVQHLGIDKNVPEKWSNMPYDICGADLSNFDQPVYFTVATGVGKRDPYPYTNLTGDYDHVVDISGNLVVWEGNGDIYAADISDPQHIKVVTVCDHPARQYDPAISGGIVVWTDERNDRGDIYGADLSDGERVREFEVAKAAGVQSQPAIDGCHIIYADGSLSSGSFHLACLTRQYGILDVTMPDYSSGAAPALDGRTFLCMYAGLPYVQGEMFDFSYSVPHGGIRNLRTGLCYDYLQHAICDANDSGDEIVVRPGRYEEKVSFAGKSVTVRSTDPNDPAVVAETVLAGSGNLVSFIEGENTTSTLRGFTVEGGDYGIYCYSSSPTVLQCTIRGSNQAGVRHQGAGGPTVAYCRIVGHGAAGVELTSVSEGRAQRQGEMILGNCLIAGNGAWGIHSGRPNLTNCTVVENKLAGISATQATVTNSIVYFNNQASQGAQIEGGRCSVSYSDVQGGWSGEGNLKDYPQFVALGRWTDASSVAGSVSALYGRPTWVAGDYHLRSRGWRWNAQMGTWSSDVVTSSCIDAGDPTSELLAEPLTAPNDPMGTVINTRIDMGMYGGTAEASLAPLNP
jgi:beta propeller repeat protein